MKYKDIFKELEKVSAPSGFEARVMEKLAFSKEKRRKRVKYLRLSFAGVACLLLIISLSWHFLFFQHKKIEEVASTNINQSENIIPVMEIINYSRELTNSSSNKESIFILEQVSDKEEIYF